LLEGLGAGLNRFGDGAFANFVANARRFEILDDRLLSGFLLSLVDGETPSFAMNWSLL
jgi:hypothetical protein